MSDTDRALIRAYHRPAAEADSLPEVATRETAPPAPRPTPTAAQLKEWKALGIRIDLPGSPAWGGLSAGQEEPETPTSQEAPRGAVFGPAKQNVAAVSEALDRILKRAGAKSAPPAPPQPDKPKIEAEPPAAPWSAPSPAIESPAEITPPYAAEPHAAKPDDTKASTAASPGIQPRPVARPRWEIQGLHWPETVAPLLSEELASWRQLRDFLSQPGSGHSRVLGIVGTAAGVGCSTLAMCLARLLSQAVLNVVVIDGHAPGDGRSLAHQWGLSTGQLDQTLPPHTIHNIYDRAIYSIEDRLTLVPSLGAAGNDLDQMHPHIERLRCDYDVVLWDVGYRERFPESLFLADAAFVVRDMRLDDERLVAQTVNQFEAAGTPIIGVAENFFS